MKRATFGFTGRLAEIPGGNGFYVYLLLAACLYFLVFGRKKERSRILSGYIVVFLAVFFCPVTAYIIQKCIGRSVYWRVLWILPAVPLIAYAGTCLVKKAGAPDHGSTYF